MGLTIHYTLQNNGDDAGQAISKLRDYAAELPFRELGSVIHLKDDACDWQKRGNDDDLRWLLIQAQGHVSQEPYHYSIPVLELYAFSSWPGEGCEEANFGLARFPKTFETSQGIIETGLGKGWHWSSFCKTQYANEYGLDNFVKCHTLVVGMLDFAKHLNILAEVSDEGEYWEKRDIEALVKEIGEWDSFIAGMAGQLKDALADSKTGLSLYAPILERPDFEHLEMNTQLTGGQA